MMKPRQAIPEWYQADWSPVRSRGELPQMSWEDVETVIDALASTPARKEAAQQMFRALQLTSGDLSPMDMLQQIILTAQTIASPTPVRPSSRIPDGSLPKGPFPRWSYTDVEVALAYSCTGQAHTIALERHRDLLNHRGEGQSGAETMRSLFLIAFGLPPSRAMRPATATIPNRAAQNQHAA